MTPEVVVALAFGFPALLIASVALYLQWISRSPIIRSVISMFKLPLTSTYNYRAFWLSNR